MNKILAAFAATLLAFNAYAETPQHDSGENINQAEYEEVFDEEFDQPNQLLNSSAVQKEPEQAAEAPKKMDMKEYKKKPKDTIY